jgi:hypothetical protein
MQSSDHRPDRGCLDVREYQIYVLGRRLNGSGVHGSTFVTFEAANEETPALRVATMLMGR